MPARDRVGVVLAAGGARGAYEAGAMAVLGPALAARGEWPAVFTGASVGAINAVTLAGLTHLDPEERANEGIARWREVVRPNVFRSLLVQAPSLMLRYARDLVAPGAGRLNALLDPSPLGRQLAHWVDWQRLHELTADGRVHAAAAVCAGAYSGRCTAFWEGRAVPAGHGAIAYVRTRLDVPHLRAASAIPVLFPAVRLGEPAAGGWFVDGATRLADPARPAVDLGAGRLVLIATGAPETGSGRSDDDGPMPSVADTAATLLHAVAVDPLIARIRQLREDRSSPPHIAVAPERAGAIGRVATEILDRNYRSVRGLTRANLALIDRLAGGESPLHGELISFLLFDRDFIDELVLMGRSDAQRWLDAHPDLWAASA
ncbi:MAG TPA: patatin-like phospholipase family protein [Solirubrobacteraceae bacterium]|nr:patatin-like phospholipase family protein [Solirubrobacteraceae bacterium]